MNDKIIKPERSKLVRYLKSYLPFWQKKKIGFYGNFGHGDLGDDASFIVGRDLLRENIMPISKRCYAFNPHILKGLLIGGGGVLRWESPYLPRRVLKKDKWGFPVILFSAGVNCDYSKEFTKETKDKINKLCDICDYITVRDRISQEFLNNLGIDHVSILPHLELALKEKPREFDFPKEGFTVGIVLTPHTEFGSYTFKKITDVFLQFTDYLTNSGNNVIYIPFEGSIHGSTKEGELIQEIMKRSKNKDRIKALAEGVQPPEVLFAIRNYCDIMVCMRLHGAVFSVNAGVPFICVSYNLMHKAFLEMLGASDLELSILEEFSFELLRNKFEYILKNYNSLAAKLVEKRDYLRDLIYREASHIRSILINEL